MKCTQCNQDIYLESHIFHDDNGEVICHDCFDIQDNSKRIIGEETMRGVQQVD